ncbi:MAG: hypothetical protein HYZ20_20525 [Burkholderiales bacterium]|nr:hypothetical protein [Burkholderiales bacterium]
MARKRKDAELIRGRVAHRRTEGDYMGVLLGAVTLEDWRDVVNGAKTAAKAGDPQARAWLAQYLMGRPEGKAPTPLNIVVQQLNGSDPLVERLAKPLIDREKYPSMHANDGWEAQIRALVAAELADKVRAAETIENPAMARLSDESGG